MSGKRGLVELLLDHAGRQPERPAATFLGGGDSETGRLSYGELVERVRAMAWGLQSRGLAGKPVAIALPPGLDYLCLLWACLFAGAIAVPMPEQGRRSRRWEAVLARLDPAAIIARANGLTVDELTGEGNGLLSVPAGDKAAIIQFTSGSTAEPRGAVITHDGLAANLEMVAPAFGLIPADRSVTWLPPWHDMGGIGLLMSLASGMEVVILPPLAVVQRPLRWLKAIDHYRATISGGPGFMFDACVARVPDDSVAELDLSSWKLAYCGSEPIRAAMLGRFADRFAHAGFDRQALFACYGLAEATLFATGTDRGAGLNTIIADSEQLRAGRLIPAPEGRTLVSCGSVSGAGSVRILDEAGAELPEGRVGEIVLSGPHVSPGYWGEDGAVREVRTGDLGLLSDGSLYVVGRIKDVIIVRGANLHAEEVEAAARDADPAIVGIVAFAAEDDEGERLIVAAEIGRAPASRLDHQGVREAIIASVLAACGVRPDEVLLVPEAAIPRTTSGKAERYRCREGFASGEWPRSRIEASSAALADA